MEHDRTPASILVIEDHPANLDLMTYLLHAFGHRTLTADDGEPGIEIARRERPDLVICDIRLPTVDGYHVARVMKADPSLRPIPLIAVTALAMVGDRGKVLAAGFDGYIAKPIVPEAFVAQVEAFLPLGHRAVRQPTLHATPAVAMGSAAAEPPAAHGATILVVDNAPTNRQLIDNILRAFDYNVILARDVDEALAYARSAPPHLILSDVHLPDRDGFALLKIVKSDRRLRAIPFVFLSSSIYGEIDCTEALARGAQRFLLRPIEPRALAAEIEACLAAGSGMNTAAG